MLHACLLALLAAACSSSPTPVVPEETAPVTVSVPAAAAAAPDQAIPALILAERQAAISGDLALLSQLWAPEARIVDGRGSPDSADDYVWPGRDAILDRYVVAVFPSPPPALGEDQLATLTITVDSDVTAHAELGVDRWRFIYRDGRWLLAELRYN